MSLRTEPLSFNRNGVVPGCSPVTENSPNVSVAAVVTVPVRSSVTLTDAEGTAAPVGSVTIPYNVPVIAWPEAFQPDAAAKKIER